MILASAEDVTRRFGDFTAVDGASLDVGSSEVVGLLGANGAGKTTLIRMLLGLLPATEGQVTLLGGPPSRQTRRRLGYVPQGLGLYVDLTVEENLEFVRRAFGTADDHAGLPEDLEGIRHDLVGDIGLGRQRRLAFAAALGHAPELIVLDEPTSGVDPLARARLWDQIRASAEGGAGVLVTTHYMQEAQQCDRVVVMTSGRVAASGSVSDVIGDLTVVEVTSDAWATAFSALDTSGAAVNLAGRRVRVTGSTVASVHDTLAEVGLTATIEAVPGTLDEAMVVLAAAREPVE